MKKIGNLYEKIYDLDNLRLAHKNASKGKGWYKEVQKINNEPDKYLKIIQEQLINFTYRTSEYEIFKKKEGKKVREIYKLPYFPDRICQWALIQVIEPYLMKKLIADTYSAIPGRGIHMALKKISKIVTNDFENCQYCLKLDIQKYYPNIPHKELKEVYSEIFKDKKLLWLLNEIIDSVGEEKGIPIGNYVSQWSGNLYLSRLDHWIKEELRIKYYFRYMDDLVILHKDKNFLANLKNKIELYLNKKLKLQLKNNWQIFPTQIRGIDYLGFRIFPSFVLLRKSIATKLKAKTRDILKYLETNELMTLNHWFSINSYKGWICHCGNFGLKRKYIDILEDDLTKFYSEVIKNEGKRKSNSSRIN